MLNNGISSVSFKAKFINNVSVQKCLKDGTFLPRDAAFVELDPKSPADRYALYTIAQVWNNGNTFLKSVDRNMRLLSRVNTDYTTRFYALTIQEDRFEKLKADKIFGVLQFDSSEPIASIDYIQVKPEYNAKVRNVLGKYVNQVRDYAGIGDVLLKSVINRFFNKDIAVASVFAAKNFYKKYGFESLSENSLRLIRKAGKI